MAVRATNATSELRVSADLGRRSLSDGYRYARAALFIFFAAGVDVFNVLDRGGSKRYLIMLVPIVVVLMTRVRRRSLFVRRANLTDKIIFGVWLMGMIGSLYGVAVKGGNTTARPLFFPMTLAFLYLFVLESPSDGESARLLRGIVFVGALYIALAAVVNMGILPHLAAFKQFRNAQFAYVMIGIAGAWLMRRWSLLVVLLVLEAFNFLAYPSATSILCTIAMLITFFITKPHGSRARPYVVAILALLLTMLALASISKVAQITGDYFVAVGKTNANNGRLAIWTTGVDQWRQSPFVGQVFTGGTVAQTFRANNGQLLQLPFHNDYVLFLAEGGLIGLLLLISFILSLNARLARAHRKFVAQGRWERANLVRLLMVGFNSFFLAASFNPVLEGLSRSAVIFSMYGLAMLVCRDDVATPAGAPLGRNPAFGA
jgi:O-antigen ligase